MKRNSPQLLAGLDVGSAMVRLAVGELKVLDPAEGREELCMLGAAEAPSGGVHKGTISSIEDVVSSISAVLERAERMVGVPIESVTVGVSGLHVIAQASKGVVAVSKADNEITAADVERAVEASRAIATPLNYEVLHVLPKVFNIDGQGNIKDPTGMTGIRLEVDTQIILGSAAQIKNLTKAVYRAGLNIDDVVLGILATAEAVLTHRQKEIGVILINLGLSTTSLAVFEEGDVIHLSILPLGSGHITNDLALGLRTSVDIAEAVKMEYGDCTPAAISKREELDLFELGSPEHELVKRQYVSEITEARIEEILRKVDAELIRLKRSGLLPAGVVFTGGGAKLPGLLKVAKRVLRLPAILGYPLSIQSVSEKINDLGFATAVGLVKWGTLDLGGELRHGGAPAWRSVSSVSRRLKQWMKALLP